jgi:hypothetical protein
MVDGAGRRQSYVAIATVDECEDGQRAELHISVPSSLATAAIDIKCRQTGR